jgi:hypothetical protein
LRHDHVHGEWVLPVEVVEQSVLAELVERMASLVGQQAVLVERQLVVVVGLVELVGPVELVGTVA